MYFDSHSHMDDRRFDGDREAIMEDLKNHGVGLLMNVGCDLESSERSVALAERYPFVYAAVGSHPDDADRVDGKLLDRYRSLAGHEKVRAIGEIGLDYHYEDVPRAQQIIAFEQQLELAEALKLPVIVHEREAHGDAMEILDDFPDVTGVFHCYSGSAEMAKEVLKLGMYIGLGGAVTFKNARKPLEVAEIVPEDRLLLETDCPYMTPVPFRGRRNSSDLIVYSAEKLAEVRHTDTQKLIDTANENARRLFKIE